MLSFLSHLRFLKGVNDAAVDLLEKSCTLQVSDRISLSWNHLWCAEIYFERSKDGDLERAETHFENGMVAALEIGIVPLIERFEKLEK